MRPRLLLSGSGACISAAVLFLAGCSPKPGDVVVATVGKTPITMNEYEKLYIKSNGSKEHGEKASLEDRSKFLDLMTKYKLKLADAYASGYDRHPDVNAEIQQYKGSLATSFLTEREVTAPGIRDFYKRRSEEIRASHILLGLAPNASPEDSAATYARAYELIALLKKGASFDSLAVACSTDPSAKTNKGDLYYFTAGQMVGAFEDAAFAMKPGELTSKPVRTQYGLHIIKVTDRKKAPGEIQCSHIMIRFDKPEPTPEDTLAALDRISAIQDSLRMGIDFADLARRNSGDPGSAPRGGDLGRFGRRRWIQEFDEMAFTLKKGEVSPIIRTRYGYHIIKCTDTFPPKTFEEAESEIKQLYQQYRFKDDYNAYVNRLKKELHFTLNGQAASAFISACDSNASTRDSAWWAGIPMNVGKQTLFTVGGRILNVDSVVSCIRARPDLGNIPLRAAQLAQTIDKIAEQVVFEEKADQLQKESPEFASIMREYKEGILLYQIEQDRVWKKVSDAVNDSALRVYFDGHRDRFTFPDRVDISEIHVINDSLARVIRARIEAGTTMEDIAREDSIRMKNPSTAQARFKGTSATLTKDAQAALEPIVAEILGDPFVRVQLTARPDTTRAKKAREQVALRRIDAVMNFLTKKHGIAASRILTQTRPIGASAGPEEGRAVMSSRVDIELVGRRAVLLGGLQQGVYPVSQDERTKKADSLSVGSCSQPFFYKTGQTIVRLDEREPARQKTFEEAGTEVSSAFQEYESKRLENEWLEGLRKSNPVTENKEALKKAFGQD